MSASLVGSEMCIRDSLWHLCMAHLADLPGVQLIGALLPREGGAIRVEVAVSYTHLTLPTICSV
eukprot:12615515-Alexandrium_andersonii.AAC.1